MPARLAYLMVSAVWELDTETRAPDFRMPSISPMPDPLMRSSRILPAKASEKPCSIAAVHEIAESVISSSVAKL